jgi:hypothetical protein
MDSILECVLELGWDMFMDGLWTTWRRDHPISLGQLVAHKAQHGDSSEESWERSDG